MHNIILSFALILFSSLAFANDTADSSNTSEKSLAAVLNVNNPAELYELRDAVRELTDEMVAENPELTTRRDLVSGGFRWNTPNALRNKKIIQVDNPGKVVAGIFLGAAIAGIFKYCDHRYTNADDIIRKMAAFEGTNLLAEGLGWDVMTFGEDLNLAVAVAEIATGFYLYGMHGRNKGKDKDGNNPSGDSTVNNLATRFCAPVTASASLGMGGYRLYSSGYVARGKDWLLERLDGFQNPNDSVDGSEN